MARDGVEILADDEERDLLDFMLNICGLDSIDFYQNERILTRENLEKNYEVILKMIETHSFRNAIFFVFGYLTLITGLKIPEKIRSEILVITELELKKKYRPKDFEIFRRICLEDFREKIKIHRPNMILRPVKLKYFGNLNLSETIIGLKDFYKALDSDKIDKIKHVKLDGWDLKKIPAEIFELEGLESLSLEFNQIKNIPKKISKLSFLEYLDLGYNYIESYANSILELDSLTDLSLDHNLISNIPHDIVNLKSLEYLGLNNNKISFLPNFLKEIDSLKRISIRDNNIKEVPDLFKSANFYISLSY